MEVKLPASFKPETLCNLEASLQKSQFENHVIVDFSPLHWSYPMGMLVAGSYFRRWIKIRREKGLKTTHAGISNRRNAHTYLMHLGFFDYAGMKNMGSKIGEAKGNTRYLPIRKVTLDELNKSIEETGESLLILYQDLWQQFFLAMNLARQKKHLVTLSERLFAMF
jgi:hypothetical protein